VLDRVQDGAAGLTVAVVILPPALGAQHRQAMFANRCHGSCLPFLPERLSFFFGLTSRFFFIATGMRSSMTGFTSRLTGAGFDRPEARSLLQRCSASLG